MSVPKCHGNPSNSCGGILLRIKTMNLMLVLELKLDDHKSVGFIFWAPWTSTKFQGNPSISCCVHFSRSARFLYGCPLPHLTPPVNIKCQYVSCNYRNLPIFTRGSGAEQTVNWLKSKAGVMSGQQGLEVNLNFFVWHLITVCGFLYLIIKCYFQAWIMMPWSNEDEMLPSMYWCAREVLKDRNYMYLFIRLYAVKRNATYILEKPWTRLKTFCVVVTWFALNVTEQPGHLLNHTKK